MEKFIYYAIEGTYGNEPNKPSYHPTTTVSYAPVLRVLSESDNITWVTYHFG